MTACRRDITRRRALAPLALLLCAFSACGGHPAPDNRMTACYSGTDAAQSALLYAADRGFFARSGLRVDLLFANGGSASVATLLAGQSQICQMSGASVVSAAQAGEDLVIVAGIVNSAPFKLMAAPSVTRPEQLIGQTVASPAGGGSYELGLRLYLSSIGVPFEQVKFAPLGSQAAVIAAMQTGAVIAALQLPPESDALRSQGFIEIPFGARVPPAFQHIGLVTRKSYLATHRPAVLAFVRTVAQAIAAMQHDEAGATAVIAKYRRLDPVAQRVGLLAAYREIVQGAFARTPVPTLDGIQFIISQSPPAPGARTVAAPDVVDGSLVTELEQSGAFRTQP